MKREIISQGIGNISACYIQEAADYISERKSHVRFKATFIKKTLAAMIILCVIAGGVNFLFPSETGMITAYAYGTNEEITPAGAIIYTGRISDRGEMKGKPLMFYLTGTDIATVRFSCKNQMLCFMDWTEQREEYGNARNFTVVYGEDESEYYYLTIDWVPDGIIRELTDNAGSSIANLPDELREDIIVMEITFGNGKKVTKALTISLQDDGTFYACFDDYEISESDIFVNRPDCEAALKDIVYPDAGTAANENSERDDTESVSWTAEQIEAAKETALAYYEGTIFSVNAIEYFEGKLPYGDMADSCSFMVNVSKGGVVQEPDRVITLQPEQDGWKVVNEGY